MRSIKYQVSSITNGGTRLRQGYGEARGAVTLPVFLLITGIVIELGIAGVVTANALNNTFSGERLATEALEAARAGAQDATMVVLRTCPLTSCPASYNLNVGARATAQVTITKDADPSRVTVSSIGSVLNRKKKMQVILSVDQTTGQVKTQSFKEVPL